MHLLNKKSSYERKCNEGIENLFPFNFSRDIDIESALKFIKNFNLSINLHLITPFACFQANIWNACEPFENPKIPSIDGEHFYMTSDIF